MSLDELQKTWRSQEPIRRITIDANVLLHEVRRNQQEFRSTIFWRDLREIGVGLLVVPLMILWVRYNSPDTQWPVYLIAAGMELVVVLLVSDRLRQRRKQPAASDTLSACAESALADVEHQVWLLRNVFWWGLLPIIVPIVVVFGAATWQCRAFVKAPVCWEGLLILLGLWTVATSVFFVVYRLNQNWVRKQGLPRCRELQCLIDAIRSPTVLGPTGPVSTT